MQVIIIEDENPAALRLTRMLKNIDERIEIVTILDSIEASVKFLPAAGHIDLIFMDIQLADGLSFYIFQKIPLTIPVIFTTAFDQYTLKAFKVNSVDYLLKPIDESELVHAIEKFRQVYPSNNNRLAGTNSGLPGANNGLPGTNNGLPGRIEKVVGEMNTTKYKERLMIRKGRQLHYLKTEETAYYFADGKLCYAYDFSGNRFMLDNTLSQLEELLAPTRFFRINRHLLVNIDAVGKIHAWLGGRLKLELQPPTQEDTVVSRERVNGFKDWLGQ